MSRSQWEGWTNNTTNEFDLTFFDLCKLVSYRIGSHTCVRPGKKKCGCYLTSEPWRIAVFNIILWGTVLANDKAILDDIFSELLPFIVQIRFRSHCALYRLHSDIFRRSFTSSFTRHPCFLTNRNGTECCNSWVPTVSTLFWERRHTQDILSR